MNKGNKKSDWDDTEKEHNAKSELEAKRSSRLSFLGKAVLVFSLLVSVGTAMLCAGTAPGNPWLIVVGTFLLSFAGTAGTLTVCAGIYHAFMALDENHGPSS